MKAPTDLDQYRKMFVFVCRECGSESIHPNGVAAHAKAEPEHKHWDIYLRLKLEVPRLGQ